MTELITTLPETKLTKSLEVGKIYLRADGGIVKIVDDSAPGSTSKRPFAAVRLCSGREAGFYSPRGTKCARNSGDAPAEKGLNIVAELVQ